MRSKLGKIYSPLDNPKCDKKAVIDDIMSLDWQDKEQVHKIAKVYFKEFHGYISA